MTQAPKSDLFYSASLLLGEDFSPFGIEAKDAGFLSVYKNTSAEYYSSGMKMKEALISDIKGAKSFIFIEFYIIAKGDFLDSILSILHQKALHGVDVRIIYDSIGSLGRIPHGFHKREKSLGIKCARHNLTSRPNSRNHRKIAVIDGECAYTGGINLADEYADDKGDFPFWKDGAVRIFGSASNELTYAFLCDWAMLTGERENFYRFYRYRYSVSAGLTLPFSLSPQKIQDRGNLRELFIRLLFSVKESCTFTTPYLILDSDILLLIRSCARQGVKIRIIIPSVADKRIPFLLTKYYAKRAIEMGAEVFEYTPGFLHAKLYLFDRSLGILGSPNLDTRSFIHNFEDGICFFCHSVVQEIKKDTEKVLSVSRKLSKDEKLSLCENIILSVAKAFSPLF